ncbi:branched-chain amino acid ABC transporter permease [Aquibaculum arenosum]|uniref:Branched-chain amino acid ABC transporter permease n=1 Tax=Aquibaculum arenosum TaxID=3032591 RepID=A0ABT5YI43_9PROT|nr:branched-chain amino acid ABC transporter permease [Fodinicurvata sp. CAU 1616]MDF2094606.1 branched-chain amino acid ABC transporter permease [Fodinicurvata sp. CAU 1616]
MTGGYLLQQMINGLVLGSVYALVAVGFSMIYGIVRLINFAHGDVLMVGAFSAFAILLVFGFPLWAAVLAVLTIGAILAMLIDFIAFRPQRSAPQVNGFITSLGVSILMQNLGILLLSGQPRPFNLPGWMRTNLDVLGARMTVLEIVTVAVTLLVLLGLTYFVRGTRMGIAMRATAENPLAARLMGIRVNKAIATAFALGGALAGLAGLLWAGRAGQIDPLMGFVPGLKAFVAAVIGGVGSLVGAVLGGYLLGFAEVLFVGLLPPSFGSYRDAFVFGLLILILLVLPNGLMGRSTEERA